MTPETQRIRAAAGRFIRRIRYETHLSEQTVSGILRLSNRSDLTEMECGLREPTLTQLFGLAHETGLPIMVLLVDLAIEWILGPTYPYLPRWSASNLEYLHRLAYRVTPERLEELDATYPSVTAAVSAAQRLNALREIRGQRLLDLVLIYARLNHVRFTYSANQKKS